MSSDWKKSTLKKSLAVLGSSAVLVMGFDYVTYAATGSSLILGLHNTEGTPTFITNTGTGAPLALVARSTIYPPFATNAKGLVVNLNAQYLGGLDTTKYQRRLASACPAGKAIGAVSAIGAVTCVALPHVPATIYVAVVNSDGSLARGSSGVSATLNSTGAYIVTAPINITGCAYIASTGLSGSTSIQPASYATTVGESLSVYGVYVTTWDSTGALTNEPFHLAIMCP